VLGEGSASAPAAGEKAPAPEPEVAARPSGPRRWLQDDAEAARAPRPARDGGTLFERMSSMARGSSKLGGDDEEAEETPRDPLDIPRFLNRQNNQ
jgi:cell division protein FtsZ